MTRRVFREHCLRMMFCISFYEEEEERIEQIERYLELEEEADICIKIFLILII